MEVRRPERENTLERSTSRFYISCCTQCDKTAFSKLSKGELAKTCLTTKQSSSPELSACDVPVDVHLLPRSISRSSSKIDLAYTLVPDLSSLLGLMEYRLRLALASTTT